MVLRLQIFGGTGVYTCWSPFFPINLLIRRKHMLVPYFRVLYQTTNVNSKHKEVFDYFLFIRLSVLMRYVWTLYTSASHQPDERTLLIRKWGM